MSGGEQDRLDSCTTGSAWREWGPYLSERQWGTVREDYSPSGSAWDYFTHDQARSRAYRWGEDGLAGISDDHQQMCLALALWNGRDAILKERLFGLSNGEGNHGEDVKEYYYYLDSTPTHSFMRYLYKYPQREFPYGDLVTTNQRRSRHELEYELIDTGIFDDDRYFDVFVEVAKKDPEDVLYQVTVCNRGPQAATIHVLPTVWFRNTWSVDAAPARPRLSAIEGPQGMRLVHADGPLGERFVTFEGEPTLLFTENETNTRRLFGVDSPHRYVKDAFHEYVVEGRRDAVNPENFGTKVAASYSAVVPPHGEVRFRVRLSPQRPLSDAMKRDFDDTLRTRAAEADDFYGRLTPPSATADEARVLRQALAGMMWSKQHYHYDVDLWLREHGVDPLDDSPSAARNREWFHMVNDDVVSMPDKWEYPWYAAWDLAFHTIAFGTVDLAFAKQQLLLMLREPYMHPNGQIPAYEWNFSDVNPPVHAWAGIFLYNLEKERTGRPDVAFLAHLFSKMSLNFSWWVNRKDRRGRNAFGGGFLGLDNIGIIDRSAALDAGQELEQADGTAWMALFSQTMLQMAMELATHDAVYVHMAVKYADHFLWIANSMERMGPAGMWDEEDGFFYDVLRLADGPSQRLKVRSLVGLLPLCATTVFPGTWAEAFPEAQQWLLQRLGRLTERASPLQHLTRRGFKGRRLLSLVDEKRLRRILRRVLDPAEFLSDYGIRSLSKAHLEEPYFLDLGGQRMALTYEPAESSSGMYGGNSNWRGPIWVPANVLIIRALLNLYTYYGDDFQIECPTGSGNMTTLFGASREIARRLVSIFTRDAHDRRPVFGGSEKFQTDEHWRDHILFYEYFHGDIGAGLGASHQTGWTGLVAPLIHLIHRADPARLLETGTIFDAL